MLTDDKSVTKLLDAVFVDPNPSSSQLLTMKPIFNSNRLSAA